MDSLNLFIFHIIIQFDTQSLILYTGTAKRLHHHWIEIGLLNNSNLKLIQERVDNFNTPSSLGHIPRKRLSGFSNMTADEWINWTIVYSVIALHDILSPEHMALFVSACTLCSPVITLNEIAAFT